MSAFDIWWDRNEMHSWTNTERKVAELAWYAALAQAICAHTYAYESFKYPGVWTCPDCDMRFSYDPNIQRLTSSTP